MRLFAILVALGLLSIDAEAQVFKPKKGKADAAEKKSAKTTKKAPKTAKKKAGTTKKKSAAAERSRPDDLTPEPASKDDDEDFVKITDDDEIE